MVAPGRRSLRAIVKQQREAFTGILKCHGWNLATVRADQCTAMKLFPELNGGYIAPGPAASPRPTTKR